MGHMQESHYLSNVVFACEVTVTLPE